MPPIEVYSVNFATGSLQPAEDAQSWGNMRGSAAVAPAFVAGGLQLAATRPLGATSFVSNSLYVVPPPPGAVPGTVALDSRLQLHAEFDLPYGDVNAVPWAVALRLKFGNTPGFAPEMDVAGEPIINVTCQFNNDPQKGHNGVRLNDPDKAQDASYNSAADLDGPLDYGKYRAGCFGFWSPTLFILDFAYSGVQAGPVPSGPRQPGDDLGYAVGCGLLQMLNVPGSSGRVNKNDLRLFSSTNLSTGAQSWIGALGVSIGSVMGTGTFSVRLRRFAVSLWV